MTVEEKLKAIDSFCCFLKNEKPCDNCVFGLSGSCTQAKISGDCERHNKSKDFNIREIINSDENLRRYFEARLEFDKAREEYIKADKKWSEANDKLIDALYDIDISEDFKGGNANG